MKSYSSTRGIPARLQTCFLFLLGTAWCGVALAQPDSGRTDVDTGGLTVEATAGWDGVVDRSTPIPVSFLISNYSGRDIDGRMTLSDPLGGREVSLGDVFVSQEGTRTLTTIQAMENWHECFATLTDGRNVVWRREIPLTTGRDFSSGAGFVLCVEENGRSAPLPEVVPRRPTSVQATMIGRMEGRPVECLGVKPWQIPRHPGPLCAVRAVLFPEDSNVDQLNDVQWQAVADWMCGGGTVFVHGESPELAEKLLQMAPLAAELAETQEPFREQRVGLGTLAEYSSDIFASDGRQIAKQIAETVSGLPRNHASGAFPAIRQYRVQSGNAASNRVWILGFFGTYTLLSGVVTLILFRLSRRQLVIYTAGVVAGACVLSALLGGMLRGSDGDLDWMSVTQVGPGGAVQTGRVRVQSSGGRNTQVGMTGHRVDLQNVTAESQYSDQYRSYNSYYGQAWRAGWRPFSWQADLAPDLPDLYRINVPMTPWGSQSLQATAWSRDLRPLECDVTFHPHLPDVDTFDTSESDSSSDDAESVRRSLGRCELTLVSHLPAELTDCWLMIGATRPAREGLRAYELSQSRSFHWKENMVVDGLIDVYHLQSLNTIASESRFHREFEVTFSLRNPWEMRQAWNNREQSGEFFFPRLPQVGTNTAWIVGRLSNSPILDVDREWTEFEVKDAMHLFVQQIPSKDLPDFSALMTPDK